MTGRDAGLVVRALGSRLDLQTAQTRYRGHAGELAAASAGQGYDIVATFGGDGTINEVVNGLMNAPVPAGMDGGEANPRPALAPIPGGSANVFARTLGLPPDAAGAVHRILNAVETGTRRTIGLGLAGDRYFTFSAGLGVDAEVVADVDRRRASGRRASTMVYIRTALRHTPTSTPASTCSRSGGCAR